MSFIPSSSASSATTPSILGASSLVPLLAQSSSLSLEFAKSPEGAALLAKLTAGSLDSRHPSHCGPEDEKAPISGSQRADKLPFHDFVRLIRNAPATIRTLPVVAIESYQKGGENAGLLPHRFSIVTALHPHSGRPTYVKLHLRAIEGSLASVLTAELADDRALLIRPSDRRLAALELAAADHLHELEQAQVETGPSLDALVALLDIVDKRVGKYDMHGRNCLWLADLVLFGSALKFRAHWLSERVPRALFPDGTLRPFLRGEIDVMTATTQCFMPQGLPWWLGSVTAALAKAFGVLDMQHEVEDVVGKWRDFVGPVLPGTTKTVTGGELVEGARA